MERGGEEPAMYVTPDYYGSRVKEKKGKYNKWDRIKAFYFLKNWYNTGTGGVTQVGRMAWHQHTESLHNT